MHPYGNPSLRGRQGEMEAASRNCLEEFPPFSVFAGIEDELSGEEEVEDAKNNKRASDFPPFSVFAIAEQEVSEEEFAGERNSKRASKIRSSLKPDALNPSPENTDDVFAVGNRFPAEMPEISQSMGSIPKNHCQHRDIPFAKEARTSKKAPAFSNVRIGKANMPLQEKSIAPVKAMAKVPQAKKVPIITRLGKAVPCSAPNEIISREAEEKMTIPSVIQNLSKAPPKDQRSKTTKNGIALNRKESFPEEVSPKMQPQSGEAWGSSTAVGQLNVRPLLVKKSSKFAKEPPYSQFPKKLGVPDGMPMKGTPRFVQDFPKSPQPVPPSAASLPSNIGQTPSKRRKLTKEMPQTGQAETLKRIAATANTKNGFSSSQTNNRRNLELIVQPESLTTRKEEKDSSRDAHEIIKQAPAHEIIKQAPANEVPITKRTSIKEEQPEALPTHKEELYPTATSAPSKGKRQKCEETQAYAAQQLSQDGKEGKVGVKGPAFLPEVLTEESENQSARKLRKLKDKEEAEMHEVTEKEAILNREPEKPQLKEVLQPGCLIKIEASELNSKRPGTEWCILMDVITRDNGHMALNVLRPHNNGLQLLKLTSFELYSVSKVKLELLDGDIRSDRFEISLLTQYFNLLSHKIPEMDIKHFSK